MKAAFVSAALVGVNKCVVTDRKNLASLFVAVTSSESVVTGKPSRDDHHARLHARRSSRITWQLRLCSYDRHPATPFAKLRPGKATVLPSQLYFLESQFFEKKVAIKVTSRFITPITSSTLVFDKHLGV